MRTALVVIFVAVVAAFAACAAAMPAEDLPMLAFAFAVVVVLGGAPVVFAVASRRLAVRGSLRREPGEEDAPSVIVVRTTARADACADPSAAGETRRTGARPPGGPTG